MLKSAYEIALEKHAQHEELSPLTRELLEHVAMLEECWDAIQAPESEEETAAPMKAA